MRMFTGEILVISGVSLLALGSSAHAAGPAQADFDVCNREAATVSPSAKPGTPVSPSASPTTSPGAGTGAGRITDSTMPGTQSAAGAPPSPSSTPAAPGNPTGGRITDSSQPGVPSTSHGGTSATSSPSDALSGMAAAGQTDPTFKRAYTECMKRRGF
jgi:hypothetical protein